MYRLPIGNYGTAYNLGFDFDKDFLLLGHKNFYEKFLNGQTYRETEKTSRNYWNDDKYYFQYAGCFSIFFSAYSSEIDRKKKIPEFYFSFPATVNWVEELVRRFNLKFKNIDVEIVQNFNGKIINKQGESYICNTEDSFFKNDGVETNHPLYTIHTKGYDLEGARYIYYLVHHYLRMLSYVEPFITLGTTGFERPEKDLLKNVFEVNNKHLLSTGFKGNYRGISEIIQPHTSFYALDDVEAVNFFANKLVNLISIRQTGALYWINKVHENMEIFSDKEKLNEYLKSKLWIYIQKLSGGSDTQYEILRFKGICKDKKEYPISVNYGSTNYAITLQRGTSVLNKLGIKNVPNPYGDVNKKINKSNYLSTYIDLDDYLKYNATEENAEELNTFIQENILNTKEEEK